MENEGAPKGKSSDQGDEFLKGDICLKHLAKFSEDYSTKTADTAFIKSCRSMEDFLRNERIWAAEREKYVKQKGIKQKVIRGCKSLDFLDDECKWPTDWKKEFATNVNDDNTNAEAVARHIESLTSGDKSLKINDLEKSPQERLNLFYEFVKRHKESDKIENLQKQFVVEADRLDIKEKAVLVLCELLLGEHILQEVKTHRLLFLRFTHKSQKAQKYLLSGLEQIFNLHKDSLMNKVALILKLFYDTDILEKDVLIDWSQKVSKYACKEIAQEVREKSKPFIKWLQDAEKEVISGDEDDDEKAVETYCHCPLCHIALPLCKIKSHITLCSAHPETCIICDTSVSANEMETHSCYQGLELMKQKDDKELKKFKTQRRSKDKSKTICQSEVYNEVISSIETLNLEERVRFEELEKSAKEIGLTQEFSETATRVLENCSSDYEIMEKSTDERLSLFYEYIKEVLSSGKLDIMQKEIICKAQDLYVKDEAVIVLCQVLLSDSILEDLRIHKSLFLKFTYENEVAQKYMIGSVEKVISYYKDILMTKSCDVMKVLYYSTIIDKNVILDWAKKISVTVTREISQEIKRHVCPFVNFLLEDKDLSDDEDIDINAEPGLKQTHQKMFDASVKLMEFHISAASSSLKFIKAQYDDLTKWDETTNKELMDMKRKNFNYMSCLSDISSRITTCIENEVIPTKELLHVGLNCRVLYKEAFAEAIITKVSDLTCNVKICGFNDEMEIKREFVYKTKGKNAQKKQIIEARLYSTQK